MVRPRVEIIGAEAVIKKLDKNISLEDVKQIVKHNGTELDRLMKAKATFGSQSTGQTRRSINLKLRDGGMTAVVKPNTHYAGFLEKGTGIFAPGGRQTPWIYFNGFLGHHVKTRGMPAQPFIRPAHNVVKEKFKADMERLQ